MKKYLKNFLYVFLFFFILVILTGCKNNKHEDTQLLKDKINTEISYLDNELIEMANGLNNISYSRYKLSASEGESSKSSSKNNESSSGNEESKENSNSQEGESQNNKDGKQDENEKQSNSFGEGESSKLFSMNSNNILDRDMQIDWSKYKDKIETLQNILTVVEIDLKEVGISEEELAMFSNSLDVLTISIENEQKDETLKNIIFIYELITKFVETYDKNNGYKDILIAKYNLLICYRDVNMNNWENLEKDLTNLKLCYSNIENQKEKFNGKEKNLKNGAQIIEELKNSIQLKNQEVFYIKYRNLMQELGLIGED